MSNANTLKPATMKRGAPYNWKGQPDRLIYLRKHGNWHQFKKIGDPRDVWCEVLDEDLHLLEATAEPTPEPCKTERESWDCKNMRGVEGDTSMTHEHYACTVCGRRMALDYDEMR